MHPLEVVERGDRLRVVLVLIICEPDLHFGFFRVGAERILVDDELIVLDRGVVFLVGVIQLRLLVVVLAGGRLADAAGDRYAESAGHQEK